MGYLYIKQFLNDNFMKQIDIFYADDDEDDLMFFNEAVEKIAVDSVMEINLHIHKNGEKLIENIKNNYSTHGVVFLDINMPLKSGFQLLEEIRNESDINQFPVIMYSTSSNPDNVNKSRTLGADFYVVKPYEFHSLLEMISTFIQIDWENHRVNESTFFYKS